MVKKSFLVVSVMLLVAIFVSWQFVKSAVPADHSLNIPVLIDSREVGHDIELALQNTEHEFYPGIMSETKGFSQSYLGPTIRLYEGEDTRIRFTNEIGVDTSVHGHGLHVSGDIDGGPQNIIAPGETWDITIPTRQQASTNWYHPHLHGKTAEHVHAGLAGLYLIEDENSQKLPLPKTYGVDDIPLVVQDRSFTNGVMNKYTITHDEMMGGKREDTLVINGTIDPYVEVPQGWVRLRLLNGSNSRFYNFHLKRNEPFYKIATEGGFLEKPVEITSMEMVPGERNEIMIDMSDGQTRELLAKFVPLDDDNWEELFNPTERVLEIRVDTSRKGVGELPETLNIIVPWDVNDAVVTREFRLEMNMDDGDDDQGGRDRDDNDRGRRDRNDDNDSRDQRDQDDNRDTFNNNIEEQNSTNASHNSESTDMQHMFSINGKSMDMSRIDERVNKGDTEVWRVTRDDMDHPFHIHGTSFLVLSQNGRPPAPEDQGWKDTVNVGWGWTELIVRFDHEATEEYPYMYHCHILEHEDGGMMGQFTVQ